MVLTFLVNGISRGVQLYGTYSPVVKDLCSYFGPKVTETEPQGPGLGSQLASVAYDVSTIKGGVDAFGNQLEIVASDVSTIKGGVDAFGNQLEIVAYDVSTIKGGVNALRGVLSHVRVSSDEVINYVKEKKKREKDKEQQLFVENVGNLLIATIKNTEKFKSKDPLEITIGVLDIISSAGQLISKPYGPVIGIVFGVIGTILTEIKPKKDQQPSVVDRLAKVVHDKLVCFNKRLQYQKYDGLKRRVLDQQFHLRTMEPGEELDDPNLWNDYVQFMGELSNRFESPLPFKYENKLTRDPDVADFVTVIVTYCEAHCCFIALLIAAKGKFAELGGKYKKVEVAVDRKISCQMEDARKKLSFLSEERYLTFLGRLSYEGGNLTKIVALSRNMRFKGLVEAVRSSLGLQPMQESNTVEEAASKVARQSVKVKADRHPVSQTERKWLSWLLSWWCSGKEFLVQFINETPFPMKIVSIRSDLGERSPKSVRAVQSRESVLSEYSEFLPGGYIIIYVNGILCPGTEPPAGQSRVIEYTYVSGPPPKLNIQDKTSDEFTHGQDTYNNMMMMIGSESMHFEDNTLYWFENGKHFMAIAEVIDLSHTVVGRFVVQDYDPNNRAHITLKRTS